MVQTRVGLVDLDWGKVEAAGWGGTENEGEMVAGSGGIPRMEGGCRLAWLVVEDTEEGGVSVYKSRGLFF